jgi:hypothetical protein
MTGFGKVRHSRLTLETGISDPLQTIAATYVSRHQRTEVFATFNDKYISCWA